jgi:hypothetical protein
LTGDPRTGKVHPRIRWVWRMTDGVVRRDRFDPRRSSATGHAGMLEHPVGGGCSSTSVQVKPILGAAGFSPR